MLKALDGGKILGTYSMKLVSYPLLCVTSRCWNAQLHFSYSAYFVYWWRYS